MDRAPGEQIANCLSISQASFSDSPQFNTNSHYDTQAIEWYTQKSVLQNVTYFLQMHSTAVESTGTQALWVPSQKSGCVYYPSFDARVLPSQGIMYPCTEKLDLVHTFNVLSFMISDFCVGTDGTGNAISPQLPGLLAAGFDVRYATSICHETYLLLSPLELCCHCYCYWPREHWQFFGTITVAADSNLQGYNYDYNYMMRHGASKQFMPKKNPHMCSWNEARDFHVLRRVIFHAISNCSLIIRSRKQFSTCRALYIPPSDRSDWQALTNEAIVVIRKLINSQDSQKKVNPVQYTF